MAVTGVRLPLLTVHMVMPEQLPPQATEAAGGLAGLYDVVLHRFRCVLALCRRMRAVRLTGGRFAPRP